MLVNDRKDSVMTFRFPEDQPGRLVATEWPVAVMSGVWLLQSKFEISA